MIFYLLCFLMAYNKAASIETTPVLSHYYTEDKALFITYPLNLNNMNAKRIGFIAGSRVLNAALYFSTPDVIFANTDDAIFGMGFNFNCWRINFPDSSSLDIIFSPNLAAMRGVDIRFDTSNISNFSVNVGGSAELGLRYILLNEKLKLTLTGHTSYSSKVTGELNILAYEIGLAFSVDILLGFIRLNNLIRYGVPLHLEKKKALTLGKVSSNLSLIWDF